MNTCSECGATREKPARPRLPKGWKRQGESVYCADCWRKQHLLRAITIPVSSPLDCTWEQLRASLREMWASTTQACNWMLSELYVRDVRRTGEEKLPPMPRQYLYPEIRSRFQQLPSQTAAAIEQTVQATYRSARYKLLWTHAVSLPNYRYPTPFPVPNQAWSVDIENERIVVSVRVGEQRIRLQLRGGPGFRRQRAAVEQMASGSAARGEMAIYQKGKDVMVKMVAWLPREEAAT